MQTLRSTFVPVLDREHESIAGALFLRIVHANAPHYQKADTGLLRLRCRDVVTAFRQSVDGDASTFSKYIRGVAVERMGSGYELREIQLVLNTLEQMLWKLCIETFVEKDQLVRALSVVSGIAGEAKDELARVYLEQTRMLAAMGRSRPVAVDLLFDGT